MMPIVRMTLQRTMRSTIAWSLAMVAVMTLYSSFWPTFNQPDVLDAVLGQFPDGLLNAFGFQAMTTGGGYMNGTFFGVLGYFDVAGRFSFEPKSKDFSQVLEEVSRTLHLDAAGVGQGLDP